MENVKGLLSATVKKELIFQRILSDLAHPAAAIDESSQRKPLEYRLVSVVNLSAICSENLNPKTS